MKAICALLSRAFALIAAQNNMRINFIFAELDRRIRTIHTSKERHRTQRPAMNIAGERLILRIVRTSIRTTSVSCTHHVMLKRRYTVCSQQHHHPCKYFSNTLVYILRYFGTRARANC